MRGYLVAALAVLTWAQDGSAGAAEGNRLTWLDGSDPYYPRRTFPKLITPQWVGEPGVDAVVVLAIDDMRGSEKWEAYLRPILNRLQRIDGRMPVSIMTCQIDPQDPQLARWLDEGLSLETHTVDHPCPLLGATDLAGAQSTFDRCVDLLASVPGNTPVAFRVPCCDSLNTASPRYFAEIFNRTTDAGNFLAIDSSVFNVFTSADPELPRAAVLDAAGNERFQRYLPRDRAFVNTIENYPYPYVIGHRCWEFPCVVPSDWEAQHIDQPNHPATVEAWKAALDATVAKQGVFNLVFHPHGWIRAEQVVEWIDYAVARHGSRVKFLSFQEAHERLLKHLQHGQPLRDPSGGDNGVRLLDLNADGYQDVVLGNAGQRVTRIWLPAENTWRDFPLPLPAKLRQDDPQAIATTLKFGVVGNPPVTWLIQADEHDRRAFAWSATGWQEQPFGLVGLELDGKPLQLAKDGRDQGVRLRDVDGDGSCEVLVANPHASAAWSWDAAALSWHRQDWALPPNVWIVDELGRDAGLRFVDLDEDGRDDLVYSNTQESAVYRATPGQPGWPRRVHHARRDPARATALVPPLAIDGQNNGGWFHSGHLWIQNETTARLPNLVDRRTFAELLAEDCETQAKDVSSPLSPQEALAAFVLPPGFEIELVACEPLVRDPVAFAWGADGRLWVAEMGDYPSGDEQEPSGGRIRVLSDSDGDGRYDRGETFLDGLPFPNGVLPWRQGVLVTCAPDLLYAEDTDGDGRADRREVLFHGFVEGNQQHRTNGLRPGLDGWIHCANGDSGGQIEALRTGETVDLGGRDYRFEPVSGHLEILAGSSQFLRECDDAGQWFGSNNANPMFHFVLEEQYLRRNPHLRPGDFAEPVSVAPGAATVYPVSRTLTRFNDFNAANRFTSACSAMIYRDDLLGAEFAGNSFVSEPVHNLVHREIVTAEGVSFTSSRAPSETQSEFLASRDNWFRPTMLRTGPDGALWMADMYRAVIEHPEYIPAEMQAGLDLSAGVDRGRIYRVFASARKPRVWPRLDRLEISALVAVVGSRNGWQRDTAGQLLVERADHAAVPLLEELATNQAALPAARIQALAILAQLHGATPELIHRALSDDDPGVRRWAARLAEPWLAEQAELERGVVNLLSDPDAGVQLQAACSLGAGSAAVGRPLGAFARRFQDDTYRRTAALTSLTGEKLSQFVAAALAADEPPLSPEFAELVMEQVVAWGDQQLLATSLDLVIQANPDHVAHWQVAALGAVLDRLSGSAGDPTAILAKDSPRLARDVVFALDQCASVVADPHEDLRLRTAALALLGRQPARRAIDADILAGLLSPQHPPELQQAAVEALARFTPVDQWKATLLKDWPSHSPDTRRAILAVFLTSTESCRGLVNALQEGSVSAADLNALERQTLLDLASEEENGAAGQPGQPSLAELLSATRDANRAELVEQYLASTTAPAKVLAENGVGRELFKKHCANCHHVEGSGHALGPDLAALSDLSPRSLLIAILDPNRAVETRFQSYTVVTTSGLTYTGLMAAESSAAITLGLADGKQQTLRRAEIETLAAAGRSLMPEGLERDIPTSDMNALLAYLAATRPPRKVFAGNEPQPILAETFRGEYWCLAEQGEVYGSTLLFEPQHRNLGFWGSADDHVVWTLDCRQAGTFVLSLEYACPPDQAGNPFVVELGDDRLPGTVRATGNWETYQEHAVAEVELVPGRYTLGVRPDGPPREYLMDLRAVRLSPR